ncbi:hypothetical protein HW132_07295 [Brasilonema sp. CT11]|nr:hypothetical protein [Brasilonema sp. CT11]
METHICSLINSYRHCCDHNFGVPESGYELCDAPFAQRVQGTQGATIGDRHALTTDKKTRTGAGCGVTYCYPGFWTRNII